MVGCYSQKKKIRKFNWAIPARKSSRATLSRTSLVVVTGLLVSVGQGIHVGVVDERVVPVTPRELLQDHRKRNYLSVLGPISNKKANGAHNYPR
jgi:hypothetical protein